MSVCHVFDATVCGSRFIGLVICVCVRRFTYSVFAICYSHYLCRSFKLVYTCHSRICEHTIRFENRFSFSLLQSCSAALCYYENPSLERFGVVPCAKKQVCYSVITTIRIFYTSQSRSTGSIEGCVFVLNLIQSLFEIRCCQIFLLNLYEMDRRPTKQFGIIRLQRR